MILDNILPRIWGALHGYESRKRTFDTTATTKPTTIKYILFPNVRPKQLSEQ